MHPIYFAILFSKKTERKLNFSPVKNWNQHANHRIAFIYHKYFCLLLEIDVYFHDVHKLSNFKYENGKHEEREWRHNLATIFH